MSNEKHVRNSFYNGSRIDDIEANEKRGPAGPQGLPGFSPSASVTQTENGARIIITDKNGTTYADITNGRNGVDGNNGSNGFSPIAEVEEVEDGAQLTVTDNRGTTTALIRNGERGERGERGESALTFSVGTVTEGEEVSVTNSGTNSDIVLDFVIPRGSDGAQGIQGPPGQEGQPGQPGIQGLPGFSPTVEVTETTNGHTVTITDKDGLHSFEVTNGTDGQNGQNGENGQNGSDGAAATISIGNVETLPAGSSAYVVNTGNENAAVFDFGIPKGDNGEQGEPGPSNVTAILTSGTEIADINGVKIYAPGGGSSDGKIVLVDYATVTHDELQNYLTNGNYVYIKNSSEYMLLYYYVRSRTMGDIGTLPDYANIYKFGCITSDASGNVQLKIYTITRNESVDSYTRELVTYSIQNKPDYAFETALADNATISSLATINGATVYSGIIDVTNCSTFTSIQKLPRKYELYCWGEYSVGTNDYRLCKLKFTSIKRRTSSSSSSVDGYIFKGEIVLDDKIIILTNTLTTNGWSGQVAKQILLSDIS